MEFTEITEITEFSVSKVRKITKKIIMNLINSRKLRIGFHRSYPQYPDKINIYESFSNITNAHIKLPRVNPLHSRILRIFIEYRSLAYEANAPALES